MAELRPLSRVLRAYDGGDGSTRLLFQCPGCKFTHGPAIGPGSGPRWSWNNDAERPTFQPSLLVQWDTLTPASRARNQAFYAEHGRYLTNEELPFDFHNVCHSFVTDGRIQFLGDCTHDLKGQTVDIPPWKDHE